MNGLNFATPWMLALLWLAPLAAFGLALLHRRRRRQGEAWVSALMREKLAPRGRAWRFGVQLACLTAAFTLAIVALARPRWGAVEELVTRSGRDLMLVLDVSRSMLATDVQPNRLERAKTDLIDLIGTLDGDRAGLILFRHKAVQVCPLTTDYGFLLQMLDAAAPYSAAPGETDIGDALRKALDALDRQQGAHQAIVLISDGEDLAEQALEAAGKARERGITIFTVGYGSPAGADVPDPDGAPLLHRGEKVRSRLNASLLGQIAARTGGVYVPVGAARADLGDLYRHHLRKRAARELDETVTRRQVERFSGFLLPAILALLAAAAVSAGRPLARAAATRRAAPARAGLPLLLLLAASLQAAGTAAPATNDAPPTARFAQSLYRKGRYAEAAEAYRKAAAANRHAADRLRYNEACARAAAGRHKEAADLFRSLLTAPESVSVPARFNQGCALLQAAEAGDAWKTNAAAAQARVESVQAAAQAFQESLQTEARTFSGPARQNLSLAAERAEAARRHAHALTVEESTAGMDAAQLALRLLEGQRAVGLAAAAAFTNQTPSQLTQAEAAAAEQRKLADWLGPFSARLEAALQQTAAASGTNAARQAAHLRQHTQALGDLLHQTADRLRDADASALEMLPAGEQAAYTLWKGIAPFDQLLGEDIRVQSNAMARAHRFQAAEPAPADANFLIREQDEAARLTRLFAERFARAVPESGLPGPPLPPPQEPDAPDVAPSNAPGITPETRAKILDLAHQAVVMQDDAVKAGHEKDWGATHTLARDSHATLKEIEDLLPKNPQPQQQPQQQHDQDQPDQPDPRNDEPKPDPSDQQAPEQPDQPEEPQPKEPDEMSEDKARAILEKARLREKEHQDEKQKRTFFDRAPSERDW